ncbi:ECs_2282 family putative zinc-binding protein [Brucella inopinata]|uniref:ECs_2282 family putative zinc-binding protein n=1 Tax=Brucella inopinata TaxID=1218315 RepID=UPI003CCBBA50
MIVSFKCPSCGGIQFTASADIEAENDFIGSVCVSCGHTIIDKDIERQAAAIAKKSVADRL